MALPANIKVLLSTCRRTEPGLTPVVDSATFKLLPLIYWKIKVHLLQRVELYH